MPAEWEPHEATWLAWPHESSDWPGKFAPIPWLYGEIVRQLARVERVRILVEDADAEQRVAEDSQEMPRRSDCGRVLPSPDQPQLDSRLLPALRQELSGRGSRSSIGNSTAGPSIDNYRARRTRAANSSRRSSRFRRFEPGLVLEGGSIDVNGTGKTADHRGVPAVRRAGPQPGPVAARIERAFSPIIWASPKSSGWAAASPATILTATSTTSRASLRRDTVVAVVEPDKSSANHEPLKENLARLRAAWRPARRHAALPRAGLLRRTAAPGQLREFLHRQPAWCSRPPSAIRTIAWP